MAQDVATPAQAPDCHPFFLDSPSGRLFALHHRPAPGRRVRGHVLCVLPFNEEMNRCRSMVTLQAQAWARAGIGTLVFDCFGTGDSQGDYVQARWELWLSDLGAALQWLQRQPGGCVALWGIRLGAILVAQSQAQASSAPLPLLFWQPVVEGKVHLNQFMRVKIAAQMDRPDLPKLTTAAMRQQWDEGRSVEIAGYEIHPDLARAIESAALANHPLPPGTSLFWLEQDTGNGNEPAAASRKLLQDWPGSAASVTTELFQGPPFWQVHERAISLDAIERSARWLASRLPA